ncbi:MAG: hypothetical protein HZB67_05130 [Candidatus Aenigmarchaeota archaeon]|nr:hypothetical protein [Candidatus Aenigmarchaeota archaeon]
MILVWKRVCKKTQREFSEKWDEVYEHIDIFSSNRSKKAILPKELTEDIAYLMGFILADGYIKNDEKLLQRGEYPEYTIALYDNSREFLEQLNIFFKQIFNVTCNLHFAKDKKGSWYVLRCTSKPVHRFFTLVLGIKKGNKTGNIDTPDIIKKSSEDIQKSFVSGFFDGEMGVGITKKNPWLEMAQSSITKEPVPIIIWMKKKLEKWGIDLHGPSLMSNQNAWRLRTNSKTTISKYYSIISSRHPDKIKQFEEIERFYYDTNRS